MTAPYRTALIVLTLAATAAALPAAPPLVLLDAGRLADVKSRAAEPAVKAALDKLLADADAALAKPAPSVTDKPSLPVGTDPHDYMSLAIYFWPNPNTPDGRPYVNRDGQVNRKEVNAYDAPRKDRMVGAVRALALAYQFTGEAKYAEGATQYLRTWFLNEKTRMNPNLNHGQFVPGVIEGRGFGIIETRSFVQLADAVTLLDPSPAWTSADREGLAAWMNAYVDWLQTSKLGRAEDNTDNNHGQWYDAQLVGLARHLGRDDVVRRVAAAIGPRRIAKQIDAEGKMPRELARTKSMHYTLFALDAFAQVADVAKPLSVDVYAYPSADAPALRKALEFVTPYLLGEKPWPYPTLENEKFADYAGLFRRAARVYGEPRFEQVAQKLRGDTPAGIEALLND